MSLGFCWLCTELRHLPSTWEGGGDEFLGPGHFLSSFKNGAETPTPFSFPSALSSGGFILYHPKLHTSERERWDCCVFHIVYIISFGPEIPLMTHPWLFQQSRKGSDHLFFSFPRLPRKKTEMMSRKFRAICNNSNFMAILHKIQCGSLLLLFLWWCYREMKFRVLRDYTNTHPRKILGDMEILIK